MGSDNPCGADNQQERLDAYIAGFVDEEVRKRDDLLTRVIPFFEAQPDASRILRDHMPNTALAQ